MTHGQMMARPVSSAAKQHSAFDQTVDPLSTVYKYSHINQGLEENLERQLFALPCNSVGGHRATAHGRLKITACTPYAH